MTAEEKQDLIEAHFNMQLSDEEEQQFEQLLHEDAAFQEMVEEHQALLDAVDQTTEQDLKAFLGLIEEQEFGKDTKETKVLPLRLWLSIAASIALVIVATYFLLPRQLDHTALFAENFEPFRNVVHPVSRASDLPTLTDSAFYFYEQGAYQQAIPIFEQLIEADTNLISKESIQLYLGISHLAVDQAEQAKTVLSQTTSAANDEFMLEKNWYLALSYIKLKEPQKAVAALKKLTASANENWKKRAESLLDDL